MKAPWLVAGALAGLLAALAVSGLEGIRALQWGSEVWDAPWQLSPWPALAGSAVTVTGALALAWFPALRAAEELVARGRETPGALELVGFVPSVVFGFLALRYLVPLLLPLGSGFGVVPAVLLLAVMVSPALVVACLPPLAAARASLAEQAAALALPGSVLRRLARRKARPGLRRARALAATRLLGESVAAAMVLGSGVGLPGLTTPTTSLAALLVAEGPGAPPGSPWSAALGGIAFLLALAALVQGRILGGEGP